MSDIATYHIVDEILGDTPPRPGCTCSREDRALIGCDCDLPAPRRVLIITRPTEPLFPKVAAAVRREQGQNPNKRESLVTRFERYPAFPGGECQGEPK